jgi:GNAT superfamily N-acetyltransferase
MRIKIDRPDGKDALRDFVLFHDRVYGQRGARWSAPLDLLLPVLAGEGPFVREREIQPFWALDGGEIVARAAAVIDRRYQRHWDEALGHVVLFEALPDTDDAVAALMDEAAGWLASRGADAARAGFGLFDMPFAMDAYEALPPSVLRQNPPYYHRLLKHACFEVEQGWVDYKMAVTPDLVARWERAAEGARRAGYAITPARELPPDRRLRDFTETWADTFKAHWGFTTFTQDELGALFDLFEPSGFLDTSMLAYEGHLPVGMCLVVPDDPAHAVLAPGRRLDDAERLNMLVIGVREPARGRGVNYALAASAFLALAERGAKWVSYTLVLDHNWPSRRTGTGLGGTLCANYLTYRRSLRR